LIKPEGMIFDFTKDNAYKKENMTLALRDELWQRKSIKHSSLIQSFSKYIGFNIACQISIKA